MPSPGSPPGCRNRRSGRCEGKRRCEMNAKVLTFRKSASVASPQPRDRKAAILDAAFPIFCSQPLADISLENIARAAGVEVADIQECIGDKSALQEVILLQLLTICGG